MSMGVMILIAVISFILGLMVMLLFGRIAVYNIKLRENNRHQELLNKCAEDTGVWQDVVNDLLDAVHEGRLQNRSIADQSAILRNIIKADTMRPVPGTGSEDERQDQ